MPENLHNKALRAFKNIQNDNWKFVICLLSKNIYFINRLKLELEHYLFPLIREKLLAQKSDLPEPFLKNYVTTTFIETVTWWLGQRNKIDEATITAYYLELMH